MRGMPGRRVARRTRARRRDAMRELVVGRPAAPPDCLGASVVCVPLRGVDDEGGTRDQRDFLFLRRGLSRKSNILIIKSVVIMRRERQVVGEK